jgi:hypothetical protein
LIVACTSEVITVEVQAKIDKAGFNHLVEAPVSMKHITETILPKLKEREN